MKPDPLTRASQVLAHPLFGGALLMMLANDFILRRAVPSWWTGKLSDFAFLLVVPLLLAAALHALMPLRRGMAGLLAFTITGGLFALVKAVPEAHAASSALLAALPVPLATRFDPTDLLALACLAPSAWLWARGEFPSPRLPRRAALLIAPLAALVLLGDAAMPNYGIACVDLESQGIYAGAAYGGWTSADGGSTWTELNTYGGADRCGGTPQANSEVWKMVKSEKTGVTFRYRPGQNIEAEEGDGWKPAYPVVPLSQAEQAFLVKTSGGNPQYQPGPFDAIEDPATGNILFAMGFDGVLVYQPDGRWAWSEVGRYRHDVYRMSASLLPSLLGGEIFLAITGVLIAYNLLAARYIAGKRWVKITYWVLLVLAVMAWAVVALVFSPAITTGYFDSLPPLGLGAAALILLPLAALATYFLARSGGRVTAVAAAAALFSAALFFVPYILWAVNAIPLYGMALFLALVILAAGTAGGFFLLRRLGSPQPGGAS